MMPQVQTHLGPQCQCAKSHYRRWIQMSGFGSVYQAAACLTEGRFQKKLFQENLARQSGNENQKKHKQDHPKQKLCMATLKVRSSRYQGLVAYRDNPVHTDQNCYKDKLNMQPARMEIVSSVCGHQNNPGEQRQEGTRIGQTPQANSCHPCQSSSDFRRSLLGGLNQNSRRHKQTGHPQHEAEDVSHKCPCDHIGIPRSQIYHCCADRQDSANGHFSSPFGGYLLW